MAPYRFKNQCKVVVEMHKEGNSYGHISIILGICCSTCDDIVQRIGERGNVRDRVSFGKPRIFNFLMNVMIRKF